MSNSPLRIAPLQLTHDGYTFTQQWREGQIAIYEQRRPDASTPTGFETVILRVGKAHPKDQDQTPKERYPSAAEWGTFGWSYVEYKDALKQALYLRETRGKENPTG